MRLRVWTSRSARLARNSLLHGASPIMRPSFVEAGTCTASWERPARSVQQRTCQVRHVPSIVGGLGDAECARERALRVPEPGQCAVRYLSLSSTSQPLRIAKFYNGGARGARIASTSAARSVVPGRILRRSALTLRLDPCLRETVPPTRSKKR